MKLGIYAPTVSGTLEWEETHTVTTNQLGLFYFIIGQGTSTSQGSQTSFSAISWGAANHYIKIALDSTGTNGSSSAYVDIDTMQFWSVPYALYSAASGQTNQQIRLNDLIDVDTTSYTPPLTGKVLKYNGSLWVPANDNNSDTALYAATSGHSNTSDTATYALNVLSTVDTIYFAHQSDTAVFAYNTNYSNNSNHSNYCDTATYALNSVNAWNLMGNSGTNATNNFIGTIDNQDFVMKTNNTERMRLTTGGRVGIGTATPTASLHIIGNDGIIAEGTFGTGATPPTGAGTRMFWYPAKGAFRAGGIPINPSSAWDPVNIGNYSFAGCYDTKASGAYSTAFGSGSTAAGDYSIAAGDRCNGNGIGSVAMGSVCNATGGYSVAMGRGAVASDSSAVAMGYHNTASGKYSLAFGNETVASGDNSVAMGFWGSTNGKKGSFVFADNSSTAVTNDTTNNQFVVRATGGVIFWTNIGMNTGVSLPAGSGTWNTLSDRKRKAHFKKEDGNEVLNKLKGIDITSWNYKTQATSIRHIGPMAQDFYAAFHFGESDTTITSVDVGGISLLAIQALTEKTNELKVKADEVEKLKAQVEELTLQNKQLEKRISFMEKKLDFKIASTNNYNQQEVLITAKK